MSDIWAARLQDPLIHTSWMSEAFSLIGKAAIYAAAGIVTAAAAAAVITCPFAAAAAGQLVFVALSAAGSDTVDDLCDEAGDYWFPPEEKGFISTGAKDTRTNKKPSARAAGTRLNDDAGNEAKPPPKPEPSFLEKMGNVAYGMTIGIVDSFKQRINDIGSPPAVAKPAAGTAPADEDTIFCENHSVDLFDYMMFSAFDAFNTGMSYISDSFDATDNAADEATHDQYIAEGSKEVYINNHPAARSTDRTTCEATINNKFSEDKISPDVRIGGEKIVVREIISGKNRFVQLVSLIIDVVVLTKAIANIGKAISRCLMGRPVAVSTGAKILDEQEDLDFILPGMLPISWQRSYDSNDTRTKTLFGQGWRTFFEVELKTISLPDTVGEFWIYTDNEGRQLELGSLYLGQRILVTDEGICVYHFHEATFIENVDTGLWQVFERDPVHPNRSRLTRLSDSNGNHLNLTYDEQSRIQRISDNESIIVIQLNYHGNHHHRAESINRLYLNKQNKEQIDKLETLVSYEYSTEGQLITVKNPANHVVRQFTYNPQHRMASHTLPTGSVSFYEWACFEIPTQRISKHLKAPQPTEQWRVVRHWTDLEDEYLFKYDLNTSETWITDNLGRENYYLWDNLYRVIKNTDALGNEWQSTYKEGLLKETTDPQGNKWTYNHDHYGHIIETKDPLGRSQKTQYVSYWNIPRVEIDHKGNKWHYSYDKLGNLLSETNPLKQTTHYEYDHKGRIERITDAAGKTKYLRWNELGQLTQYKDCSGFDTLYQYDERYFLSKTTNARLETIEYLYDSCGYLTQSILPDGRVEQYQRNKVGLLTGYLDPAKNLTQYQYDNTGKVIKRIDAQGRSVSYQYDAYERLTTLTNENNESYQFEWDELDRLILQTELDGGARRYHYNTLDHVIGVDYIASPLESSRLSKAANDTLSSEQQELPIISHKFERDALGRLIKKLTDDGTTEYNYDKNDNLQSIVFTDNEGNKQSLSYSYDELNQLISETNNLGELKYSYDELGNLEQLILPDKRTINHHYYGSGHLHQISLDNFVISDFERDSVHQEVLRTQGRINTQTLYDRTGLLTEKKLYAGKPQALSVPLLTKAYQYDSSDNLIAEIVNQYQYRPSSKTNQEQADRLGQKLPIEPHGFESTTQQQPTNHLILGKLQSQESANTNGTQRTIEQLNTLSNAYTTTRYYNYDSTGHIQQSYSNNPQGQGLNYEILHYDAAANLLSGDTSQGYVKHNRLHVYQDKRYNYDRFGRLAEKRIAQHTIQIFKYDAEHRIIEIKHTERNQTKYIQFKYDPLGRRVEKTTYLENNLESPIAKTEFYWQGIRLLGENQNGLKSLYLYENIASYELLARIDGEIGKEKISYFHTNFAGLPEQLIDEEGNITWQAEYEIWGKAREEWHNNKSNFQQNLRYQGQYLDRETGLHYNTFRYYDPDIGRFTQPDPIGLLGGNNFYQYAPNPIAWADPWGWRCKSQFSGDRGRNKAKHDIERNGYTIVAEEVTMKVNGSRVRADFVAIDGHGKLHIFEAKHGTGGLTPNQKNSGVFDMSSPANTAGGTGGGTIKPSSGTKGSFTLSTKNKTIRNSIGTAVKDPNYKGGSLDATFNVLKY